MKKSFVMLMIIVVTLLVLIIDISLYFKYLQLFEKFKALNAGFFRYLYWIVPAGFLIFMYIMLSNPDILKQANSKIYWISGSFIILYVPKIIALFIVLPEYILNLIGYFMRENSTKPAVVSVGNTLNRMQFLSQLGFLSAGILFGSLLWGALVGKTSYTINRIKLKYRNLPKKFNGFKIVQISDFHLGSWLHTQNSIDFFTGVVAEINALKPDIIVFTGDLVNNRADEATVWVDYLNKLEAKDGKYSVLGNHDYGKYARWNTEEEYNANMQLMYDTHKKLGFKLLNNANESITKDNETIHIIGVENWGNPPFPQYGDYYKAISAISANEFHILLSHDPSHWDSEIRHLNSAAMLTLSGHTHGMQFALNFNGKSWSPVQWKYKFWRGLYSESEKNLYVNIGLGNIAYPGRVGAPPEITYIELETM